MPNRAPATRDTSISTYRAKRDFTATPEPAPGRAARQDKALRFVVQKHDARRLHWDFRLEHDGVLWSWAVPKGPSLDPHDKRLAVRVEDHPLDYADFHGSIPEGHYGAGTVEIWDSGSWAPLGDAAADLARGELKFTVRGARLQGGFVLVRLKRKPRDKADNWLLIKEHDAAEQAGADAETLEAKPAPKVGKVPRKAKPAAVVQAEKAAPKAAPAAAEVARPGTAVVSAPKPAARAKPSQGAPVVGAVPGPLPEGQKPQLATLVEEPPEGEQWLSEVKFDGYRLLASKQGRSVHLTTRNGLDWTQKLPDLARSIGRLKQDSLLLDGELVALRPDGLSSFAELQTALSAGGKRGALYFYAFDLLYLEGWDLRPCALRDRKALLQGLDSWKGALRYSDHLAGATPRVRRQACQMGLEGIICKRADAPYKGARTRDWVKLKCQGRDEFIVLGWTPPAGSRTGLGALHMGFHDHEGRLHYIGGVGTGFSDEELRSLTRRLGRLVSTPPEGMQLVGEAPDRSINWVRPELVAEVQYIGWTGTARLRHATYLGLRQDKAPEDVVRDVPEPQLPRETWQPKRGGTNIVRAGTPKQQGSAEVGGVTLTHAERELWPGITKQDLAEYWRVMAPHALPEIGHRPLALVRCPEGIGGQHFFQKHASKGMPEALHAGAAAEGPWLAVEDAAGLLACAQMAAIELHGWGATLDDTAHPERIVLDLDPGEDTPFGDVVKAALELRDRLKRLGLESFCRTTGGKGLHVVAPLDRSAGWDQVKPFCRDIARAMESEEPARFLSTVSKAKRRGRILVDWLRNGPGATAVCSYVPRARPNATVATPLAWREVTAKLDPQAFTLRTVPQRLAKQKAHPWVGFDDLRQGIG